MRPGARPRSPHVVAVHGGRVPAEGAKTVAVAVQVVVVHGVLALAVPVHVHHADEIVQTVESGQGGRFPNRALGRFSVPHEDIDPVSRRTVPEGQRHSHADGQSLAQGPGADVDPAASGCGMPLQLAVDPPQSEQPFHRKGSAFGQGRVKDRCGMSLGEHEAVIRRMIRPGEVEAQELEEDGGDQVGTGEAGSRMSRSGLGGGDQRVAPQTVGHSLEGSDSVGGDHGRIWI